MEWMILAFLASAVVIFPLLISLQRGDARADIQHAYKHGLSDGWRYGQRYPVALGPGPDSGLYGPHTVKHKPFTDEDAFKWSRGFYALKGLKPPCPCSATTGNMGEVAQHRSG